MKTRTQNMAKKSQIATETAQISETEAAVVAVPQKHAAVPKPFLQVTGFDTG